MASSLTNKDHFLGFAHAGVTCATLLLRDGPDESTTHREVDSDGNRTKGAFILKVTDWLSRTASDKSKRKFVPSQGIGQQPLAKSPQEILKKTYYFRFFG